MMAEFKIVISDPKTGKSYQREAKEDIANTFLNMKIGYDIKGEALDLPGYEFRITGGSDNAGFPMRPDISGLVRKRIFAVSGIGLKKKEKGIKQRKTVCGNVITESIAQINMIITKYGRQSLETEADVEKKEEKKVEDKPAEKKEAKPAEDKKEEKAEEPKKEKPKQEEKTVEVKDPTLEKNKKQ